MMQEIITVVHERDEDFVVFPKISVSLALFFEDAVTCCAFSIFVHTAYSKN